MAVVRLQFFLICVRVISYVAFVLSLLILFLISPFFIGDTGELCFVIMTLPVYLNL